MTSAFICHAPEITSRAPLDPDEPVGLAVRQKVARGVQRLGGARRGPQHRGAGSRRKKTRTFRSARRLRSASFTKSVSHRSTFSFCHARTFPASEVLPPSLGHRQGVGLRKDGAAVAPSEEPARRSPAPGGPDLPGRVDPVLPAAIGDRSRDEGRLGVPIARRAIRR